MQQFWYTRIESIPQGEGQEAKETEMIDSFNADMIIRTMELPTGARVVLLNDLHERLEEVPIESKTGKVTGHRTRKTTYQSEIILSSEDNARFKEWLKSQS